MAAAAILHSGNHNILLADGVCGAKMYHRAKLRQNRSMHCRNILIFHGVGLWGYV